MAASSETDKKPNPNETPEPNYDLLMDDLKGAIIDVYSHSTQADGDLNAKKAIQILHEIELKIDNYMKEVNYIQENDHWAIMISKQVKVRRAQRITAQKFKKEQADKEAKEVVKKKLEARMNQSVKRVGKPGMGRSEPVGIKKKKAKKEVPEHIQDQKDYLGVENDQLAEMAQQEAARKL